MEIAIPSGWYDMGMDWDNPNPSELKYTLALLGAIEERLMVKDYHGEIDPPDFHIFYGSTRTRDMISYLSKNIDDLLSISRFIDMDYQEYHVPSAQFYGLDDFPKGLRLVDIQKKYPDVSFYPPYNCASNTEVAEYYKACKIILSELRYTSAKNIYTWWNSSNQSEGGGIYGNEYEDDYQYVYQDIQDAIDNHLGIDVTKYKHWPDLTLEADIGTTLTSRKSGGPFSLSFKNAQLQLECTHLPRDLRPKVCYYAIADKISLNKNYYDPPIQNDLWCDTFEIYEPKKTKLKELGDYISGTVYSAGTFDIETFPRVTEIIPSTTTQGDSNCNGSRVKVHFIFDWYTPGGFKFQK